MLCDRGRAPKFCLLHSLPEVQLQSSIVVARFGSAFSYIHVCGNLVPVCSLICWNVCLMCLEWKLESINYWITYTILHDQFLVSFWFSFWSVIKCYSMTFYWNYDFCLQEQITKIKIYKAVPTHRSSFRWNPRCCIGVEEQHHRLRGNWYEEQWCWSHGDKSKRGCIGTCFTFLESEFKLKMFLHCQWWVNPSIRYLSTEFLLIKLCNGLEGLFIQIHSTSYY